MREMADPDTIRFDEARQCILAKDYTPNEFDECLDEYERLNVWQGSFSYDVVLKQSSVLTTQVCVCDTIP